MRYHLYSSKIKDVEISICIDIVNGKYRIGEKMPTKVSMSKDYGISRQKFDEVCDRLEKLDVIRTLDNKEYDELYVPNRTTAIRHVAILLAERLKECSRLLELIGFGAREARNQLYLKQIVNTLPLKLKELEVKGKIQGRVRGEHANDNIALIEQFQILDENMNIISPEYQDVIDVLQDML